MSVYGIVLPAVIAAILSAGLTPVVRAFAFSVGAVDHPGPRKIHDRPIARLGGLAVILAVVAVCSTGILGWASGLRWAFPGVLLRNVGLGLAPIVLISVWDDIRGLSALPKLAAHALGAGIAVFLGVSLPSTVHVNGYPLVLGWLAVPISILWLMGVTSAFNLVDGLDGLSAGLALISACGLVGVFVLTQQSQLVAVTAVVVGAILGFLPWNVYPARVFLGDTGATALGFTLGCLSIASGSKLSSGFATLIPVLILGLPVAETLVSMARRIVRRLEGRGGSVMEGDLAHFHHRLLDLGLDQRRAVLVLYGAGLTTVAVGFLSIVLSTQQVGLLLAALAGASVMGISRLGYNEFAVLRRGRMLKVYETPVLNSGLFVVFVDLVIVLVAVWIAAAAKYDTWGLGQHRWVVMEMVAVLFPATVLVLWPLGLYRSAWRLSNVDDVFRLLVAIGLAAFAGLLVDRMVLLGQAPASLFVLYGLVKAGLSVLARTSYRLLYGARGRARHSGSPMVIYGAGEAGSLALREIWSNEALMFRPVAFVDDDPRKKGTLLNGVEVAGGLDEVPALSRKYGPLTLLVASRKIGGVRLLDVAKVCTENGARLLRIELVFRELLPPGQEQRRPEPRTEGGES